jgi:hypothetical protein
VVPLPRRARDPPGPSSPARPPRLATEPRTRRPQQHSATRQHRSAATAPRAGNVVARPGHRPPAGRPRSRSRQITAPEHPHHPRSTRARLRTRKARRKVTQSARTRRARAARYEVAAVRTDARVRNASSRGLSAPHPSRFAASLLGSRPGAMPRVPPRSTRQCLAGRSALGHPVRRSAPTVSVRPAQPRRAMSAKRRACAPRRSAPGDPQIPHPWRFTCGRGCRLHTRGCRVMPRVDAASHPSRAAAGRCQGRCRVNAPQALTVGDDLREHHDPGSASHSLLPHEPFVGRLPPRQTLCATASRGRDSLVRP